MYKFLDILFGKKISLFMYFGMMILLTVDMTFPHFIVLSVIVLILDYFYYGAWLKLEHKRMTEKVDKMFSEIAKRRPPHDE